MIPTTHSFARAAGVQFKAGQAPAALTNTTGTPAAMAWEKAPGVGSGSGQDRTGLGVRRHTCAMCPCHSHTNTNGHIDVKQTAPRGEQPVIRRTASILKLRNYSVDPSPPPACVCMLAQTSTRNYIRHGQEGGVQKGGGLHDKKAVRNGQVMEAALPACSRLQPIGPIHCKSRHRSIVPGRWCWGHDAEPATSSATSPVGGHGHGTPGSGPSTSWAGATDLNHFAASVLASTNSRSAKSKPGATVQPTRV